jgi:hypothetical protein
MLDYGEILIAIWDGKSTGTNDMVERAVKKGMPIYIFLLSGDCSKLIRNTNGTPFCITKL